MVTLFGKGKVGRKVATDTYKYFSRQETHMDSNNQEEAMPVAPSLPAMATTSLGNRKFIRMTLAPTLKAVVSWERPASKLNGRTERMWSSAVFSRYWLTLRAPAIILRCDKTTPFGSPVLPEV